MLSSSSPFSSSSSRWYLCGQCNRQRTFCVVFDSCKSTTATSLIQSPLIKFMRTHAMYVTIAMIDIYNNELFDAWLSYSANERNELDKL